MVRLGSSRGTGSVLLQGCKPEARLLLVSPGSDVTSEHGQTQALGLANQPRSGLVLRKATPC